MAFVIKLNSSEALSFFGFFGLVFSLPNFNKIFLNKLFPIIIENSTMYKELFKLLYIVLLLGLTYESFNWVIQLVKNIIKTQHLNVDYTFYLFKIIISGIFGIVCAIILNKILF